MKKITELTAELAAPAIAEQGCTLWDVEYVREGGTWYLELAGDLAGQYYQYELQFPDGTSTVTADPYAHAAGAGGTRSMVLNQAAAVPDALYQQVRPHTDLPLLRITPRITVPEAGLDE